MSSEANNWFAATELSLLGERLVAGLPKTMQGCKWRAKKEGWVSREVKGSGGPGGMRTEYQPPAAVLALIHTFLDANPDFFGKAKRRTAPPAAPPDYPKGHSPDPLVTGSGKQSGIKLQDRMHPQAAAGALDLVRLRLALTLAEDAARATGQPMSLDQKADLVLTFYQRLTPG